MPRDYTDTTSTCGSCMYFSADTPDGGPADGHCGWMSLPAYVYKNVKEFNTLMRADAGKDCWLHTKRPIGPLSPIDPIRLLKAVASKSRNVCKLCGHEHNMMPCPTSPPSADGNGR